MNPAARRVQVALPGWLARRVLHFETEIESAVKSFAQALPGEARVLDAGAGEGKYRNHFSRQRYTGVDLGVGDTRWNYSRLDVLADLLALPFPEGSFDAAINIVTLEHVREPKRALAEIGRVLKPGGRLLIAVPHQWEVHQAPHDYYRYTRYGIAYLLEEAGLQPIAIEPSGGLFRLLSRRMLGALQFFPGFSFWLAALFLAPPALVLPWFDSLDRNRDFTLGYICTAEKR